MRAEALVCGIFHRARREGLDCLPIKDDECVSRWPGSALIQTRCRTQVY